MTCETLKTLKLGRFTNEAKNNTIMATTADVSPHSYSKDYPMIHRAQNVGCRYKCTLFWEGPCIYMQLGWTTPVHY